VKKACFIFIVGVFLSFGAGRVNAATLSSVSDTITTSRPSAASPLSADAASSALSVSIYNNGSRYLASDSAQIVRTSNGADIGAAKIVAAQTAALTGVSFTDGLSSAAQAGTDVLITNITAMHTVSFQVPNPVPASGKIVLTFPGSALTTATPSASTFSFNGLTSGNAAANISYKLDGTRTCTFTVAAPSITCTVDSGGSIAAGTVITFLIGCSDTSSNETTCTTQAPRLINPTKTAAAGTGDTWTLTVTTQDSGSTTIDSGFTKIATIESVVVSATVDSTLTFTIAGIANGSAVNTGNTTGCTNTELTNSGTSSTATAVNLGALPVSSGTDPNISAQLITVATNAFNGYSLTATASGHLINPATGFAIADSTTPAVFPATTPWFGIHACGADVNTSTWGTAASTTNRGGSGGAKYGWPTKTSSVTLATDSSGPITGSSGNGLTTAEYAAAVDSTVPPGTYTSVITYVATATF
jgi:hypothetical protein